MLVKRRSLISSGSVLLGGLVISKADHLLGDDGHVMYTPSIGYAPWPEEGSYQFVSALAPQNSDAAVIPVGSPIQCQIDVLKTGHQSASFPNHITVTQKFRPLDCCPVDVTVWAYDRNPVKSVSSRSNMRSLLQRPGLEFKVNFGPHRSELGRASFAFEIQPNDQCADTARGLCEGVYLVPLASQTQQKFPWAGINLSSRMNRLIVSTDATQPNPTTHSFIAIGIKAEEPKSIGA